MIVSKVKKWLVLGSRRRLVSVGTNKIEIFCVGCSCSWFGVVIEGE